MVAGMSIGIVPPYLLEHLSDHPDPVVASSAQRTLSIDGAIRERRARNVVAPAAAPDASPNRSIADAEQTMRLPGRTVRNEGDPATDDETVTQAYDGLGDTWTMLFEAFQRDSLDGGGMPLLATVHYGDGYDNAFWNGERMVFGDGDGEVFGSFTNAVDVIGHELGHGLISATTDLEYEGQSGALNESVADVIGSLAKQHTLGQDAGEADWLVGVGIFTDRVQGVALRSLRAPGTAYDDDVLGKDPQPATMADYVDTTSDNGGVHINSGIPNHAFYLAATAIGGYAWEHAGRVWIDVLENGSIGVTATFAEFANATIDAAVTRFGEGSAVHEAVQAAWTSVGVEPNATTNPAPTSPTREVVVERSGGMLGRTRTGVLPESALPHRDLQRLEALIDSGALLTFETQRPMPDAYTWHVRVVDRIDAQFTEPALPEDVRDLFLRILELGEARGSRP